jgi:peptidoglycan hydrolase-like protein with peptidoglycan-binding domain
MAYLTLPVLGATALQAVPSYAVQGPPSPSVTLPSALDVAVPYQGMTFCDPVARPGVIAFAKLMSSHYGMGSSSGITRACGNGVTEHSDGRAWDWMLNSANPSQREVADSVVRWLTAPDSQGHAGAMARRFGIMYIIWNRHMWRAYDTARGWAPYNGSSPHTDHIHFSFTWNGAMAKTSWWTGRAATSYLTGPGASTDPGNPGGGTPPPTTALKYGMESELVKELQRRLGGLPVTGWFGPMTQAKVREFQQAKGLPVTGVADVVTLAKLGMALPGAGTPPTTKPAPPPSPGDLRYGMESDVVKDLQRRLGGLPVTGWFGPMTQARVKEYQKSKGLAQTGVADSTTRAALGMTTPAPPPTSVSCLPTAAAQAAATAAATVSTATRYTAYLDVVLRPGCSGAAVRLVQTSLGGVTVDGVYGSATQAAVSSFQRAHALTGTGVVDKALWRALEHRDYPYIDYRLTVLRYGSESTAVVALQKALGVSPTGWFGPITQAAVKAFQQRNGIPQTGVAASLTWTALDRLAGH